MDIKKLSVLAASGLALSAISAHAEPFAFQGQLNDEGAPADGIYDLEFALFDTLESGTQISSTIVLDDQEVVNGSFLVELDFGDAFDGSARWIEISVRQGDDVGGYTELAPRIKVGNAPQASYAIKAGVAESVLNTQWSEAPGILTYGTGLDQVIINRDSVVSATDVFGVHSAANGLGGMTVSTWSNGMPYYGYSTGGFLRAYSYYDPFTDAIVFNKGGDQLEIDDNNDVIITNNLIVGGTITSMSDPEPTNGVKSYTPETIYSGLSGSDHIFNSFAGSIIAQGSGLYTRADLDLPQGSIITNITVQFVDQTTATDLRVQLSQRNLNTMAFTVTNLRDSIGSMNGAVQTMTITSPGITIDNTVSTYDLRFASSSGTWPSPGNLGVRSVMVEYTAP